MSSCCVPVVVAAAAVVVVFVSVCFRGCVVVVCLSVVGVVLVRTVRIALLTKVATRQLMWSNYSHLPEDTWKMWSNCSYPGILPG